MSIIGKREITYNLLLYNNPYKNNTNKIKTNKTNSLVLLDHQLNIYEYLKSNKSILLFHKMGSGKTISSLYSAIKLIIKIIK